jgi:hypothetical protein
MTNFQQVNIWVEAEAFFDSLSDVDIALRIVAGEPRWPSVTRNARPVRSGSAAPRLPQSWSSTDSAPRQTGKLIAALCCDSPARCVAFASEQHVVAGNEGVRMRKAYPPGTTSMAALTATSISTRAAGGNPRQGGRFGAAVI